MSEKRFVLDEFCDRVTAKKISEIAKQNAYRGNSNRGPIVTYATETEAWEAATVRAVKNVEMLRKKLKAEERRAKKCTDRFMQQSSRACT
jgi:hypothetical protein